MFSYFKNHSKILQVKPRHNGGPRNFKFLFSVNMNLDRFQGSFWDKLTDLSTAIKSKSDALKILERIKSSEIRNVENRIHATKVLPKEEVMEKIEREIKNFLSALRKKELPKFVLNKRGSVVNTKYFQDKGMHMVSGVTKHEISLENELSLKKYTVMMTCLCSCYKLLQADKYSTKRDLYYSNVNLFQTQSVVDEAISDISCMLGVPRHSLHVLSSSKGFVYGNLTFKDQDQHTITCHEGGVQVPTHIEAISEIVSGAKYILVVEKEATYQRLVDHDLNKKLGPCILMTGKGFPDINTRMLLRKLATSLEIPVFAFVDADPHGIEIMFVYKYGSRSLAHEAASLTCPSMRWLGIHPKDVDFIKAPKDVLIPLSDKDRKKASEMLTRPYVLQNPGIHEQIQLLIKKGSKAEIECLDSISYSFMTDIYLPQKLRDGDWL